MAIVKEVMSDRDKHNLLQDAVTSSLAVGNTFDGPHIRDIYADTLTYEIKNKLYQMSYHVDPKGKVVFGNAERVIETTVYTPVQEKVEAKINELTEASSGRKNGHDSGDLGDRLLALLEKKELTEADAEPVLKEADELIEKLSEREPVKEEDGINYPRDAFAFTPSDNPATWQLRLFSSDSIVTKAQLQECSAMLSPGGSRGIKAKIPEESLFMVKNAIRSEYHKLGIPDSAIPRWVKEDGVSRERLTESCEIDIAEVTKEGISKGIVPVRIIRPGFNSSKSHFYSEQSIKDAAVIFEGTKMYADHPTKEEDRQRPERSIVDWVATLHETKVADSGNAVGIAHINAGWLKEKIQTLHEQGDLQHLGTSINAVGRGSKQTVEGTKTIFVEGLVKSAIQSVDFVTEPGAGGHAGLRESATDNIIDADLIDLATFKEARPDLVEAIESEIREQINTEGKSKMEAEQEIKDLKEQVDTLTTENTGLKETAAAAEKEKEKAAAQAIIKETVEKADLPEPTKARLLEVHAEDTSAEGIEEVIKGEAAYIKSLSESVKIRDMGPTKPEGETDPAKIRESMVEGFIAMGMSKEEAETAADGR